MTFDVPGQKKRFIKFYTICNNRGKKHESSGISDVVAMKDDRVSWFEIKSPGKKQRESQKAFYELLGQHGMMRRYVVDNWDEALNIIQNLEELS